MRLHNVPARLLKSAISIYAYAVSPLLGSNCRFYPTCSCYAREAIDRHGALQGSWLTVRRLIRCHPWYKGPILDPVPQADDAGRREH